MKNYIQDGARLQYANSSGSTITSGTGVLVGKRLGVAVADIANNTTGVLAMDGVFLLPKTLANVIAQGDLLYWNDTAKELTSTASGNTFAGYAHKAAGSTSSTIECRINR